MKKNVLIFSAVFIFICVLCFAGSGCETVKGMGRDIKKADDWFKDHAW